MCVCEWVCAIYVMSKEGSWYDRVCVGCFVTRLIYYFSVVEPFVSLAFVCALYPHIYAHSDNFPPLSLSFHPPSFVFTLTMGKFS